MKKKNEQQAASKNAFPVVGLGASAGGLQALTTFFKSLSDEMGMAFIVIVHLSPDHKSNLAELLQVETSLKVQQVKERVEIEKDHVYIIPPKKLLKVGDNHLELSEPPDGHKAVSIDYLFRSLGEVKGRYAVGVILSGAGSDGTIGIKTVKEEGGLVIVQEPKEAEYTDMPLSAIDSGLADFVLSVKEIVKELLNYKKSLSQITIQEVKEGEKKILQKIFTRIRSRSGHDFSNYKRSSILRRIERRMQVNRAHDLSEYLNYLNEHPDEIDDLFQDLLISVTNFFRDEEAFNTLEDKIIHELFADKEPEDQLRVWVPGCATGEEAYSIAMLLREYAQRLDAPPQIQIFATDIDEAALNVARQGRYPDSISTNIAPERIRRFFTHNGAQYEIREEIRDMILFAPHNLLRDPPFLKLELIVCRNLLIYLNRKLQSEVFGLFHYALRPDEILFLGLSDSNLEGSELFNPVDKKQGIYRRIPNSKSYLKLPQTSRKTSSIPHYSQNVSQNKTNFETLHRNLLARRYAPQSVLINENYKVLHATENITKFLHYSGGEPSHDILQMVKPELRQVLQSLLFAVGKKSAESQHRKISLQTEEAQQTVDIIAHPVSKNDFSEDLIHIIFKEVETVAESPTRVIDTDEDEQIDEAQKIINTLQQELENTRQELQITVEEYETSNEELRASNEELQSTTEELETSGEELQSVNEELKAVNQELESKVINLNQANSDLKNLMDATEVGIIFVDRELCVQRFTSDVSDIFNLIDSDKGRPLEHVTHRLDYDSLIDDVKQVLNELTPERKTLSAGNGKRWYIMRLRPYRTTEGQVKGVVLTFVEITQLNLANEKLEEKARQEEALARLGLYALTGKKLDDVIHRGLQIICEIIEMDFCMLHELDYEENIFKLKDALGPGFEGDCPPDVEVNNDNQWDIGFTFRKNSFLITEDYGNEKRFRLLPYLNDFKITSGVNLIIEGTDEAYGVLSVYSREQQAFSRHDVSFLQVVSNLIGEAIDRTRANEILQATNEQLKEAIQNNYDYQLKLMNNSIAERWEIGSYLHDNLAQTLVSAKMMLNDIGDKLSGGEPGFSEKIRGLKDLLDEALTGIRNLTHNIIPIDFEAEGVEHAFQLLMQNTQEMYGVNCTLKTAKVINEIKNRKLATNLYYVIQEAVKNAATHGEAKNISVSLSRENENLIVQIKDNGIGFVSSTKSKNNSGISIMKHRMELLGGTLKINKREDTDNNGTIVRCSLPLAPLTEEESEK